MMDFKQMEILTERILSGDIKQPKVIKGDVDISRELLTKFPEEYNGAIIEGDFNCSFNDLSNLEGAPIEVSGNFNCTTNDLTSLKGAPAKVGGDFNCSFNDLSNLEGAPTEVDEDFNCWSNPLTSLGGAPKSVKGKFRSNRFTNEDYRSFVSKRDIIDPAKKKRQEDEDSLPW